MGKLTGFKEYAREVPASMAPAERVKHYREFDVPLPVVRLQEQGARCMDCGVPFCQPGCPLGNIIPDWNDLVYRGDWQRAIASLHSTNNFPEFTGRTCPAPCEEACVLGINETPVTIKNIELSIVERAFREGWINPEPPEQRTQKRVAVVGSGPAGLACADQLNRAGHWVTVFERADRIGGLLRYGIPDFKLEKWVIDRRLAIMTAEGIIFQTGVNVGCDISADQIHRDFDAVVLCGGATVARDLPIPGCELDGVHPAMEFLVQQNKRVSHMTPLSWWFRDERREVLARGKHVIIIGGGDTGSDCVGTCNRQGAASVTQFELLAKPPEGRPAHQPWPYWPVKLRTTSSHQEGCDRHWSLQTVRFNGERGRVRSLETVGVARDTAKLVGRSRAGAWGSDKHPRMREVPGTKRTWPADLVLLAMGFVSPDTNGIVSQLGVKLEERGCVQTDERYMTSVPGVFACGDMRRGQSLVVWAISEGREAAHGVDGYLMGSAPGVGPAFQPVI